MKRFFAILALCLLLCGCGREQTPPPPDLPDGSVVHVDTDAMPYSPETLFEQLFDLGNKISFRLDMTESEIAKMQRDYEKYSSFGSKSPIYRMADLHVTLTNDQRTYTYIIKQVGVRMKGNTSRTSFYNEQEGIYNLIHLKLSFQETFDDPAYYGAEALQWEEQARTARKDRTFATLEKIDLKWNKCDDTTYIKEHYAYEMYRENGVLAPHTNLVSLDWAGIHMGVCTFYEPIDKIFLEKNLPKKAQGGDLYKLGWTNEGATFTSADSIGIEDEDAGKFYRYDLKTNKKTSAHESLRNLIATLNSGALTKERVAELVDMENFLQYAAVSWFLGNPDDLRNNYNNCYIYFRGDTGKLMVIPYDYDRCLGVTKEWNPTGHGMTTDDPFTNMALGAQQEQQNPLFLATVVKGGYYVREFAEALQKVAASQRADSARFAAEFAKAQASYASDARPNKHFHNAGGHRFTFALAAPGENISFAEYVAYKKTTLTKTLQKLDEYASGAPQLPADLYIRAEFTDWNVKPGYEMKAEGDRFVFRLSGNRKMRFKVYSRAQDNWFGSECLSELTDVNWSTDDHTNIILPAGTYQVVFDPADSSITVYTLGG